MSFTSHHRGLDAEHTDQAARAAAVSAIEGRTSEASARRRIAVLLSNSVVVDWQVASFRARYPAASSNMIDVMRAESERLLTIKVEQTDVSSSFDLARATRSSPVGWASHLLRSASASLARKVHRRVKEVATDQVYEPADGRWSSISKSHANFTGAEKYLAAHAWLEQRRSVRSQSVRDAEHAFAFIQAFDLPAPIRPHFRDRRQIHRTIRQRPQACWHAAAKQFIAVGGAVNKQVDEEVDDRVTALWDDYSPAQLARLVSKDDRAAPLLGLVFTDDFVRPSAAETKRFVAAVARKAQRAHDKKVLREAARALIEVEFSTAPLNLSTTQTSAEQRQAVQDDYTARAPELFAAATDIAGSPLGAHADEVYAQLYEMARPFTRERVIGATGSPASAPDTVGV